MQFCFIKKAFLTYLAQTSPEPPLYQFTKAKGIYLYDEQGKAFIDLISGVAVNNIGHRNKRVVKAIKKQLKFYMHQMVYGEYIQGPQVRLAQRLAQLTPDKLDSVYFLNSGSEAIEGALKLAKKYTGRKKIVAFRNAYHGSTAGALSLMDNTYYSGPFKPLLPEIYFADFNNTASLSIIDDATAAVVIEPIQGENGYVPADPNFLRDLRNRCNATGSLLVFDEIQSGIGRTGKLFAMEHYGIVPDILTLAKGIGAGMPLSCFIANKEVMDCLTDQPILGHITTFGGHPVSCAASLALFEELEKKQIVAGVAAKEQLFRALLQHEKIEHISGVGLMLAVELGSFERVDQVIKYAFQHGLIIDWFLYANTALRIAPPLIISEEEIVKVCEILKDALDECKA